MQVNDLLAKIQEAAKTAKVDAEANMFSRLAERVAAQGEYFEKPLTKAELNLVKMFM